jgi:tetratricopeptide (TPR) repeat protein
VTFRSRRGHETGCRAAHVAAGWRSIDSAQLDQALQAELVGLHSEWFAALDKGDGETMDRLEAQAFQAVFSDGRKFKKVEPRGSGRKPTGITRRTLTGVDVRRFGETAILTGMLTSEPSIFLSPASSITTVVFVRERGEWRIASAHWTTPPDPEATTNLAGYQLLEAGRVQEAIEILKINAKVFPQSWNAYDSLGEAYDKAGNTELALQNYSKSVELNPANETGVAALKRLRNK